MSGKATIVLWGGWWKDYPVPQGPHMVDSHASVNAYFLGRELERFFDVVRVPYFGRVDEALGHREAVAILSSYQAGFTQLRMRCPETFRRVRRRATAKLCSILDLVAFERYEEDVIFTVNPKKRTPIGLLKRLKSGARIVESGWCAAPEYCMPRRIEERPFTIFLDHGHYAGSDYTGLFVDALNLLAKSPDTPPFRVFYQGNRGVEEWRLGTAWHFEKYDRASKVPWLEMISRYRNTDLFCVTHPEAAGLAALEAAMSGATLCVPVLGRPFIDPGLLSQGVNHLKTRCRVDEVAARIRGIMESGVDNFSNHQAVSGLNWGVAAERIHRALSS